MGRTLFNSTIDEKRQLLERLKQAPDHDEVKTAIRVVEDSQTLHEMHKLLSDIQFTMKSLLNSKDPTIVNSYTENCAAKIDDFYLRLDKRKRRRTY